jgi:predicted CXXCH cytochrome family protein
VKSVFVRWSFGGILIAALIGSIASYSMPAQAGTDSCVAGKCHSTMGKAKAVHPPVKDGMCTACHAVSETKGKSSKHPGGLTITLVQQGADLCTMCHEAKNTKKVVHAPIMGGDCTGCHNPHQSPNKGMLREPAPKLCFQCHADTAFKSAVLHPPVASGDCSTCHDNHQSDFSQRLVMDRSRLCFMCHSDKEEALKKKKVVHAPVKQSCVKCHDPHGSPNATLLTSTVPTLCAACHPNEVQSGQKSFSKHAPTNEGKRCLTCHDAHASDHRKLLPQPQMELCLGCHDREIKAASSTIRDMKGFLQKNKVGHGPLKDKNCSACHDPHGSDYWRLMEKYYTSEFYASYADGRYALCFSCHASAAFTEMTTKAETKFRDGSRNLHFVHVNKKQKGRTCKTCHEVHADTGQPRHIKDMVRFSGWEMPMNFIPTRSGGSCAPGCHGEKKYSR